MSQTKQEKEIERMFESYSAQVYAYADKVFWEKIAPYLEKFHLDFVSGNGTFFIGYTDKTPKWFVDKYYCGSGGRQIDVDKIDVRISNILHSEIDGMNSNDLGSIMPDYDAK